MAGHVPHAPLRRTGGERPGSLAGNVPSGLFSEAEPAREVLNPLEAELLARLGKEGVVGKRHRLGQGNGCAPRDPDFRLQADHAVFEGGQRDGEFEGGARLETLGKGNLLVDGGQDASPGRVDDHDGAVPPAESREGDPADFRVLTARVVLPFRRRPRHGAGENRKEKAIGKRLIKIQGPEI